MWTPRHPLPVLSSPSQLPWIENPSPGLDPEQSTALHWVPHRIAELLYPPYRADPPCRFPSLFALCPQATPATLPGERPERLLFRLFLFREFKPLQGHTLFKRESWGLQDNKQVPPPCSGSATRFLKRESTFSEGVRQASDSCLLFLSVQKDIIKPS